MYRQHFILVRQSDTAYVISKEIKNRLLKFIIIIYFYIIYFSRKYKYKLISEISSNSHNLFNSFIRIGSSSNSLSFLNSINVISFNNSLLLNYITLI
jgi:hypothetical protein